MHLRDHHKEDIYWPQDQTHETDWWWAEHFTPADWWRCSICLSRVFVSKDSYICKTCRVWYEPERFQARKSRFGGLGLDLVGYRRLAGLSPDSTKELSTGSKKETQLQFPEEQHQESSPGFTGTSKSTSSALPVSQGREPVANYHITPATFEFTHSEYQSYKIVPFTTVKQLGHGSLGSVDAGRRSGDETGPLLARKVIRLPNMARKRLLPLIQQEVAVLHGLQHRHIVQVMSTYETTSVPRQFGILLSPAGDEDLSHYLERVGENDFPEKDLLRLRRWPLCLASAVAYIHSKYVRHKDMQWALRRCIVRQKLLLLIEEGDRRTFTPLDVCLRRCTVFGAEEGSRTFMISGANLSPTNQIGRHLFTTRHLINWRLGLRLRMIPGPTH